MGSHKRYAVTDKTADFIQLFIGEGGIKTLNRHIWLIINQIDALFLKAVFQKRCPVQVNTLAWVVGFQKFRGDITSGDNIAFLYLQTHFCQLFFVERRHAGCVIGKEDEASSSFLNLMDKIQGPFDQVVA